MHIEADVVYLGNISPSLIEASASVCSKVPWANTEFNRTESTLVAGRLCLLPYAVGPPLGYIYSDLEKSIITSVKPIISALSEYYPGFLKIRGEVATLMPGAELVEHIDNYWFHKYSKRIHVPIITNLNAYQLFQNKKIHLQLGSIHEINNLVLHSATNCGTAPRVHLIVDLMSPEKVAEARQTPGLITSRL